MAIERKIKRRLSIWVAEGLVTSEQARAIESYEENQSGSNLLFWMGWLAGSSIVLGIIALIASNWIHIPPSAKLLVYFLGFAGAIYALVKTFVDKPLASEILRLALMGYTMAGIGLVAQIYHLHSAPYRGIFFWCAITLGLALSCSTFMGAFTWLSMVFVGLGMYLDAMKFSAETNAMIVLAVFAVCGALGSRPRQGKISKPFQDVAFVFAGLSAFLFSLTGLFWLKREAWTTPAVMGFLASALLVWAISIYTNPQLSRITRLTFCGFLAALTAHAALVYSTQSFADVTLGLRGLSLVLFVAGTLSLALSAFSFGKRRVFEALIIALLLRLFFVYAEHLFSAMMGGIGLIFFGLLILAAIFAWQKLRTQLFTKLEEIFHVEK